MSYSIKLDDAALRQALALYPARIDRGMKSAIFNVMRDMEPMMREGLLKSIDRPTPFTSNKFLFYKETISESPAIGRFGVSKMQAAYLQFMIKGRSRDQKIIERKTPTATQYTPARSVQLDRFGNIPKTEYLRIMKSAFGTAKGRQFVAIKQDKGKLKRGIYKREDGRLRPWLFATDSVPYRQAFDFEQTARAAINQHWAKAVNEAVEFRLKKG